MGKKEKKSSSVLDLKKSARPEGLARFVLGFKIALMETEHSEIVLLVSLLAPKKLCQPTTPRLCVVRVSTWPSLQINFVETFNTALRILLMEEIPLPGMYETL